MAVSNSVQWAGSLGREPGYRFFLTSLVPAEAKRYPGPNALSASLVEGAVTGEAVSDSLAQTSSLVTHRRSRDDGRKSDKDSSNGNLHLDSQAGSGIGMVVWLDLGAV